MSDLDTIKQIEKELDVKLSEVDEEIRYSQEGYTLNQERQVTGLGLDSCKIKILCALPPP